jgi:hypothetical protein
MLKYILKKHNLHKTLRDKLEVYKNSYLKYKVVKNQNLLIYAQALQIKNESVNISYARRSDLHSKKIIKVVKYKSFYPKGNPRIKHPCPPKTRSNPNKNPHPTFKTSSSSSSSQNTKVVSG